MIRLRALFLATLAVAFLALGICAQAQVPTLSSKELQQSGRYLGPASCASSTCHGSVKPRQAFDVKQNEYFIWSKQDKHSRAYDVLLNERSLVIARNLRLKGKPSESAECLTCHALVVEQKLQARPLDVTRGVSCESCHGPSTGWIAKHMEQGSTHDQSVKAGMTDLRTPAGRAQACLSCHLGDSQRDVNHKLIAAGHPNLIFELGYYASAMPPHWTAYRDRRQKEGREEAEGARAWAVGQAVALRGTLALLAQRARAGVWPEFAEMDCYGCHHALKEGTWRQRSPRAKLGLSQWSPRGFAMLRHLVAVFAPEESAALDAGVKQLAQQIARLSTRGETVAATATGMIQVMDRIVQKIGRAPMDDAAIKKLADLILNDVAYLKEADLQSTLQAALALNALGNSLARSNPALPKTDLQKSIDALYAHVDPPERFDPERFIKQMSQLKRYFK
jgi:hypothetical protein